MDDAIFAAQFNRLIAGSAPKVYGDAKSFDRNTHPTAQLKKIASAVFGRLANEKQPGITVRLSTGYGGGKTHALMALWHLAHNIDDSEYGIDLLPYAGRPKTVTIAAIDAQDAGQPDFSVHGNLKVHSMWGELAYRLLGSAGVKLLEKDDDIERQPSAQVLEKLLPKGPVLILLDELVIYMATLSERAQKNLLAFLRKLMNLVSHRPQTVLVVTDPGSQATYSMQASQVKAALQLDDEISRLEATDFDPVGEEAARIIARRLFEKVDPAAAETASASYHNLYRRVAEEKPGLIPTGAITADYAQRIRLCYPFHPRLMDTAQNHLGPLPDFHKSRGVLRLFARIIRSVWERGEDVELITAGEIDWFSPSIQADLLSRLNKDSFKHTVDADVKGHARDELDAGAKRGIHQRVASALLLESLPLDSNCGLNDSEVTLAVLHPEEAGPEPSEALQRLTGVCWHTYPLAGNRGWQFRYEPNVIRQIEERAPLVPKEDALSRVQTEAQRYFGGPEFKLIAWPGRVSEAKELPSLQLALCETEEIAQAVCAYSDDSKPEAPMPRGFVNAIIAIAAPKPALQEAVSSAQRLVAAKEIEDENRGDSGKMVRAQLEHIKPVLLRHFLVQTCRAFNRVFLAGRQPFSLDEKGYTPEEDKIMQKPQGQVLLRKYLEDKKLIYVADDGPDLDLFLKNVLPGAVPKPDQPGVFTTKAVLDRFLSAPKLLLVPGAGVARNTLLRAVQEGRIVVQTADGRVSDHAGSVEGAEGQRHRTYEMLNSISFDDSTLVTRADSEAARRWLHVDPDKKAREIKGAGDDKRRPEPEPETAIATTWEQVQSLAGARPLLKLELTARDPAAANDLIRLAQPLGAMKLLLDVVTGGSLRDEGSINFQATNLKHNHSLRPLAIAQTLFNALADGADYEVQLKLDFGSGRSGLSGALKALSESAGENVVPNATFGKPYKPVK